MYYYPLELSVISRRIVVTHSSSNINRHISETITLFNSGSSSISEIALEMEDFRADLNIFTENGSLIPFLTKEKIGERLSSEMKEQLDDDKIFLAWMTFNMGEEIKPGSYKLIRLQYIDYRNNEIPTSIKGRHFLSISKPISFSKDVSFFSDETLSLFFDFEWGTTHDGDLQLIPKNKNNEYIMDEKIGADFHYEPYPHNITLSISGKKREKNEIQSIDIFYFLIPDQDIHILVESLTYFSILFPFLIIFIYIYFKNLTLFGIMSTTEFLAIVSIGITRFPTTLISVKGRTILTIIELSIDYIMLILLKLYIIHI